MKVLVFGIIILLAVPAYLMLAYLFRRIRRGIREKPGMVWYFNTVFFSLFALAWFLALLLALYGVSHWAYTSIRNYNGYCTYSPTKGVGMPPREIRDEVTQSCYISSVEEEKVRGRRFTTEERLDIAIDHYLCNQTSIDYREIEKAEQMRSSGDVRERFALIYYGSKGEFMRENPDCCKLTPYSAQQDIFGYDSFSGFVPFFEPKRGSERASGMGDGMFVFKHKIRYTDQGGTSKEIETTKLYIMVNNCGYPWDDLIGY